MSSEKTSSVSKFRIDGADEDVPRVLRMSVPANGGKVGGIWVPPAGLFVLMLVESDGTHHWWRPISGTDCPGLRSEKVSYDDIAPAVIAANEAAQKLKQAGPSALRGNWAATLTLVNGTPQITVSKPITSYQSLVFTSSSEGWQASVEKKDKWFQTAGTQPLGTPFPRFAEAVAAASSVAVGGPVSDACSLRDSARRTVVDANWAATHELRRPAPLPDLDIGKLLPPPKPPAPIAGSEPKKPRAPRKPRITPADAPAALESIPAPAVPSCPTSVQKIADATTNEADALTKLTDSYWAETEQVELLKRAGKLIRQAQALISSPHCSGAQKEAAIADLRLAAQEYESARQAILAGGDVDVAIVGKRVAERISLAALRAAKSCAKGGNELVTLGENRDWVARTVREGETAFQSQRRASLPSSAHPPSSRPPTPAPPRPDPELVVVPIGTPVSTAKDLAARLTGATSAYNADPSASKAKNWVKSAIKQVVGTEPTLSAKSAGTADSRYVEVTVNGAIHAGHRLMVEQALAIADNQFAIPMRVKWEDGAPAPARTPRSTQRATPPIAPAEPRPMPSPVPLPTGMPPIPAPDEGLDRFTQAMSQLGQLAGVELDLSV